MHRVADQINSPCSRRFHQLGVSTGRLTARFAQPLTYTFVQFVVVASVALSLAPVFEPISIAAIAAAWDSIVYVGMLSSAVTFGLMALAVRR